MERGGFQKERGVALLTAFSISIVLLGLIASLYWISVQRHVLMRKRAQHARALYLTEAGMNDAIARLRIGGPFPPGIPAAGANYCLDVETATPSAIVGPCAAATCAPPNDVRVCVTDNSSGRNQIDVTANF